MKQDEISILWQRYITNSQQGHEPYFDADEIDALLDDFEEKDDYTHYEPILKLGLRLHPDSYELKIRQCRLHVHNEEYEQALDLLECVAKFSDLDADMMRLECYCALDMYNKVVEYMEKLVRDKHPQTKDIFEFLAPVMSDFDMMTEAKSFIHWGLQLFPDDMVLKDELCYLYELDGDYEEAINTCNELIDVEPYSYDYWFTLGRLYSMTNDFDNAIDAFDFALTCDDSDENLKVLKAYCHFMNENYEKALEVYTELIDSEGDKDSAMHIKAMMAECYIKLDDYDRAYMALSEVINIQGGENRDPSVYINFIRVCLQTDRESEAAQILSKAADIFPDNVRILSMLALNHIKNGKEDSAMEITNKILHRLSSFSDENEDSGLPRLFTENSNIFSAENLKKITKYYKKIFQLNSNVPLKYRYILPENLTKEYLKDKNNSN
ncbi:MAG: tetratricopeptide repeat protein [Tannerellaceae bacterium]|jgi:tetratricopeptide (TPR) repeat protein|nr:tetratricopeptide repeat protein [Tannerellaceae bacterium]